MKAGFFDPGEVLGQARDAGLIDLFDEVKKAIEPSLFFRPYGIHGTGHTERVLFHTILLSHYLHLDRDSRNLLMFCALYHDIGRDADGADEYHGANSVRKIRDYDLWVAYAGRYGLPNGQRGCAMAIIRNHCVADGKGIADIKTDCTIGNRREAIDLYLLFKDADGLDRVRLMDLDIRYLRSPAAKCLPLVADRLLQMDDGG